MDDRQRERIATIQKAMTKIAMRRLDLSGFLEQEDVGAGATPHAVPDEEFQARMLALLPGLVVVVHGLWDMHNHQLSHTQGRQSHVPPGMPAGDEQGGAETIPEILTRLAATVDLLWEMHLGELPHPPVDRAKLES